MCVLPTMLTENSGQIIEYEGVIWARGVEDANRER